MSHSPPPGHVSRGHQSHYISPSRPPHAPRQSYDYASPPAHALIDPPPAHHGWAPPAIAAAAPGGPRSPATANIVEMAARTAIERSGGSARKGGAGAASAVGKRKKAGASGGAGKGAGPPSSSGGAGIDYAANPAGPASSATQEFRCAYEDCGKVYRGKHARSVWRRHLQDKHGIPLSAQPRRTRWDNDANRPKSEEERRARTLDSKRRWARRKRAEKSGRAGSALDSVEPEDVDIDVNLSDEDASDDEQQQRAPSSSRSRSAVPPVASSSSSKPKAKSVPMVRQDSSRYPLNQRDPNAGYPSQQQHPQHHVQIHPGHSYPAPHHQAQPHPDDAHYYSPYPVPREAPPSHQYHEATYPPSHHAQTHLYSQHSQHPPAESTHHHHAQPQYAMVYAYQQQPGPAQPRYYSAAAPPPHHSYPQSYDAPSHPPRVDSPPPLPHSQPTFYDGSPVSTSLASHVRAPRPRSPSNARSIPAPIAIHPQSHSHPFSHHQPQQQQQRSQPSTSTATAPAAANEDAAAVLVALRRASSPLSSPSAETGAGPADTSLESNQSFAFSTRSGVSRRAESPPSEAEDDKAGLLDEPITELQSRALKRLPILPSVEAEVEMERERERERERGSRARSVSRERGTVEYSTSLVRTPAPAPALVARHLAMDSSPPFPDSAEITPEDEDDEDDEDDNPSSGSPTRSPMGSPTRARRDVRKRKYDVEPRSSSRSATRGVGDLDSYRLRSPNVGPPPSSQGVFSASRSSYPHGEMLPPHPGSSSSASSFNLSTPAGPSRGDSYRPFFPSSAGGPDPFYSHSYSHYPSTSASYGSSRDHSRLPLGLSSPPSGSYLFSSPAHPGFSKTLGLTAQPGPGVLLAGGETPGRGGAEREGEERKGGGGWGERVLPGIRELEYGGRRR
ncbi:hypothetical protein MNV49_001505 [Pseudohyphozyma bogoriensis]|nr:hypothetical protein MNV49_001505 [Pseudohyphozyma bogoriensis]